MALRDAPPSLLDRAFDDALATIRRTAARTGEKRPCIGQPDLRYAGCAGDTWVEGFWPGQLWLAYAETRDPILLHAARQHRPYFVQRLARPETHDHDLGFLYSLSMVADYKLTGDREAQCAGLRAAKSLAGRFNQAGKYIRAWNEQPHDPPLFRLQKRGKMIIDCMENVALLFWAAQECGNRSFWDTAVAHSLTAARLFVRDDGSSYHTYDFDPVSGRPLGGSTHQGYSDESCWSRGQAWGIHGFAQTYAYTRMPVFRDTAQRLADYALAHLPADGVPLWDYCLPPHAPQYRDSSAAAVTAAGLLLLADQLVDEPSRADRYRTTAHEVLSTLATRYSTRDLRQAEGLLLHGAGHVAAGATDTMLPYGDYFYLEALLRARGRTTFFW